MNTKHVKPRYSNGTIDRAGRTLATYVMTPEIAWGIAQSSALDVLSEFRGSHDYPLNTFQATLRNRLHSIDKDAFVMQRLKRLPSIVLKLNRFKGMQLSRMQDIGGLRAVTASLKATRSLEKSYLDSQLTHRLRLHKDYIKNPKPSGYRSVHLVYEYNNRRAPQYDGLLIELQIRTAMQHSWASAVETIGTYIEHSLKSSEGPSDWLNFFSLVGSAFAHLEASPAVPNYEHLSAEQTYREVAKVAGTLNVFRKLAAFSIATRRVTTDRRKGAYHLVVLDLFKKVVNIYSYPKSDLDQANQEYLRIERYAKEKMLQVVLVSTASIKDLRRAYPSYFLDTRKFLDYVNLIVKMAAEMKK